MSRVKLHALTRAFDLCGKMLKHSRDKSPAKILRLTEFWRCEQMLLHDGRLFESIPKYDWPLRLGKLAYKIITSFINAERNFFDLESFLGC